MSNRSRSVGEADAARAQTAATAERLRLNTCMPWLETCKEKEDRRPEDRHRSGGGRGRSGLRYVSDDRPGYTRKRKGDDSNISTLEGKPIRGRATDSADQASGHSAGLDRCLDLSVGNGHIQATGRDARGRKQYRYHERWREVRDENKYEKMAVLRRGAAEDSQAGRSKT